MKHKVHHGLDRELARKATHQAAESYKERFAKYNPQVNWVTDDKANVSFSAKGVGLDGSLEVTDDDVLIDLDVPFILKPFKKKAVSIIEAEINKWVAKAKNGDLD